ncbi:ABC transporter permease [Dictyobacter aurantiacus]|uniref:ABC transporter permease n=1 Tax=Dictyobacter aurantiacus TaxID=1936993 RepID=A0A401ZC70_9CHLR|nr:ABC transporter permease [Dictyobacter aurantiacus]GCE04467.1 hypothetical protein KDAU_17960 [Dictyobacter aurantiacus]
MSTAIMTSEAERTQLRASTPSFFGIVRGELLKMSRRWSTWIPLVLVAMFLCAGTLVRLLSSNLKEYITAHPLDFMYREMENGLAFIQIFTGLYFLVLVAYVIGLEYQMGTIRVLIARGVGKLTLLAAKVTSVLIMAALVIIASLLLTSVMICIVLQAKAGNLDALKALNAQFWSDSGLYLLTVLISTVVTILLGTMFSVLGRSLTIGLSAGLAWFPVDNIGAQFLRLGYLITQNDIWKNVTAYFLGPNLNVMASQVMPARLQVEAVGIPPLVKVDGPHTLWVALVYGLIFLVVSIALTVTRDIKE